DLAVAVPVGGVREFEGNEHIPFGAKPARAFVRDLIEERLADQGGQEFMKYGPLVVPSRFLGGLLEDTVFRHVALTGVVDKCVMDVEERQVHLSHEGVGVVPRVADDRNSLGISRHVRSSRPEKKLRGVTTLKEEGMTDRPVSIQTFEIQ